MSDWPPLTRRAAVGGIAGGVFAASDEATAQPMLDGDLGKRLFAEMAGRGIKRVAWGWYGWRQTKVSDRAMTTPDDTRGLMIRIQPGPVFVAMFHALGAIPVPLDGSEVYLGHRSTRSTGRGFHCRRR